jgi:hypothetical protein
MIGKSRWFFFLFFSFLLLFLRGLAPRRGDFV